MSIMYTNDMQIKRLVIIMVVTSVVSGIVLLLFGSNIIRVSNLVAHYYPCAQDYASSFPCQTIYDMYVMLFLFGISVVALIVAVIGIFVAIMRRRKG